MKSILLAYAALIGSCLAADITVDPAGATLTPGPGITITGNNAWTTANATWTGTEWNSNNNYESWTRSGTTGAGVTGGILSATSNTADPQLSRTNISGGPDLDLGWNDFIDIRIRLPLNYAGNIEIYYGFTATTDGFASQRGFSGTRMVTIPNSVIAKDNAFHVYRIDMGLEPLWRGKLSDLRIDPATLNGTAFSLDYVRIGDVPGNDYTTRISENCPAHGTVKVLDGRTHTVRSMESKRFRIIYSDLTLTEDPGVPWSDAKSRGTLRNLEEIWQVYVKRYGYKEPCYPMGAATGPTKFKTNMTMIFLGGTWAGGDYDPANGGSFGWQNTYPAATRVDAPSWVNAHEFMHICQFHQGGNFGGNAMGKWFEAHADYGQETALAAYPELFGMESGLNDQYMSYRFLYATNPFSHYRVWPIFFYLDQNPDGIVPNSKPNIKLSARLWQESLPDEYIYATIDRITKADGGTGVKDIVGGLARREAIYDYGTRKASMQAAAANWNADTKKLREYSPLVRRADDPTWWQIPSEIAPQAFAYTIHDLVPATLNTAGRVVSVNFRGLPNPARQADWRASLVVVNDAGNARYSSLWNDGVNSVTLAANENRVYLSVAATPGEINSPVFEDTNQSYKSDPAKTRFPYEVQLTGASVRETGGGSTSGLVQHANGGGWKASTATVASTAYIGPNARVLDTANLTGNARIEDYAVVKGSARIQENAIVSGHAVVRGKVTVKGDAKIREYALVSSETWQNGVTIEGRARIGGRRMVIDDFTAAENATLKGVGYAYQAYSARGDVIIDGDGLGNAHLTSGAHTGWLWDDQVPARAATMPALNRLVASYEFPSDHPHSAIDQYGVTDATLIGSPTWLASDGARSGVISFNGNGQRALLSRWLNDSRELTVAAQVKWSGIGAANQAAFHFGDGTTTKRMFLTPSNASGVCSLQINSGGNSYTISAASALPANTWTRVAVTLDGTTARLYLDGALAGSTACPVRPENLLPADTNETPAHNFLAAGTSLPDFQGSIDDFKVYSVALPGLTGVGVSPLAATLSEMSGPLTFTFTRSALDNTPLASPLLVNYTVTGSATPGVDFVGLATSGSVTIPAGQTSTTVQLSPITDSLTEGNESFSVNIIPGANYGVTTGPATITLQDPVPLQNDLLAWYQLNETTGSTATDSSSNNNHATVNGAAVWNPGELALTFDGTDDYVQTPVPADSTRTLAAWIRPHNAAAGANDANVYNAHIGGEWGSGWGVRNNQIYVVLDDQDYNSGVPISNNIWQHVAVAFDSSTVRIYVNGQLKDSRSYNQGAVTTATYRIGRSSNNDFSNVYFDGDIRDAKIYGRAVNDLEVLEVQQGNQPAPTTTPSSLTATPVNGSITLAWQPANNGESWYTVRRATSSGGPYTTISGAVIGTTFTDTSATPGTTYYYVVVAANSSGSGPESTNLSATAIAPTDGTWTIGTSGNWSDPTNWMASLVANGADRIATFSPASAVTITQNLPGLALGGLSFNNVNTIITGDPLTLDVASGTPTVQVASGLVATLSNSLQGSDGVNKTGPGQLTLAGGWSFTGPTILSGGILASGAPAGTSISLGQLNMNGGTLAAINGGNTNLGNFQLRSDITVGGSSTSVITADVRVVNNETRIFNVAATGDASGIDLSVSGKLGHHNGTAWGFATKSGPGVMKISGPNEIGKLTVSEGKLILENTGIAGMGNGGLLNNSQVELGVTGSNSVTFSQTIQGSGTFTKTGTGTLSLYAGAGDNFANTYNQNLAGGLHISDGTVELTSQYIRMGSITIGNGGTLKATAPWATGASNPWFNGRSAGSITVNAGGTLTSTTIANSIVEGLTLNGGSVTAPGVSSGDWGAFVIASQVTAGGSTTSTISAELAVAGTQTFDVGSGSILNISGLMHNRFGDAAGAITKSGPGTLVLSAANSYTGSTSINAGTLLIHGSTSTSSAFTVADNATLGGNGTVGGAITVNTGGTLAPGAAVGTLTAGSAAINGTLAIEISGATADRLNVTGNLNITNATLAITGTPTTAESIIASFGSLTGSAFATVSGLPSGYQVTYDLSNKQIKLTASGFAGWIGPFGVSNPAANADPDFDGIPNAIEYVLGGNPSQPSANIAPTVTASAGNLVFSFQRTDASETPDITLVVEASTNLTTWPETYTISPGTPTAGVSIEENGTAPDTVTVTIPQGSTANKFARMRVLSNP